MEKLMIYPFDIETMPLVRHKNLLNNYDILALVSPSGWGMNDKDASIVDNGSYTYMRINNDFEKMLHTVDSVMFSESHITLDFTKMVYPKIMRAINSKKNIICTMTLDEEVKNDLIDRCKIQNIKFQYLSNHTDNVKILLGENERLYEVQTPVIFICGTDERTDKFEIQLLLREKLLKEGYKLSQIGTKSYCNLLGIHHFPSFIYRSILSEVKKVVAFNHYVKSIELKEQPDVILIGIPFGLIPLDNEFNNNFGIIAYEISNAIKPDYAILTSLYADYELEYFDEISTITKYKFGFDINCFNISNTRLDWNNSKQFNSKMYMKIDSKFIDRKIVKYKKLNVPIINILNEEDACFLCSHVIESLSENKKVDWL